MSYLKCCCIPYSAKRWQWKMLAKSTVDHIGKKTLAIWHPLSIGEKNIGELAVVAIPL